jgi:two-component sensor histidine kinase
MSKAPAQLALAEILSLLRGAGATIFSQDTELRYRWLENPPKSWATPADVRGKTDLDLLPTGAAATVMATKRAVLSTGRPHWAEFVVEKDHTRQDFELYIEAEKDGAGAPVGLVGLAFDVTERRKRLEALEAIVRQYSHRSKNLLAILQSLAVQTARAASSTEDFIGQFRGRIQSISRSQDIALGPSVHGAGLSELIAAQVEPYVADAASRIAFQGADCELTGNAALHIGLALSELTIQAANEGVLAHPDGTITITAERVTDSEIDPEARCLRLTWREQADRRLPLAEGFTRQLLERLIPSALGGHSALASCDDGLRYVLTVGPGEFTDHPSGRTE